jgi:hypothetical protein
LGIKLGIEFGHNKQRRGSQVAQGGGLQNHYSWVRLPPAPPKIRTWASPIRCARHEKDFFLLGANSSVWDYRLICRPAQDARRSELCLGRVTRRGVWSSENSSAGYSRKSVGGNLIGRFCRVLAFPGRPEVALQSRPPSGKHRLFLYAHPGLARCAVRAIRASPVV